jgi:transcriptional regulator with XRE-family HTH domain
MNRRDEGEILLKQAYFGYTLLCDRQKADMVRKTVTDLFGLDIITYGVENIVPAAFETIPFQSREQPVNCENIGVLIGSLRSRAGMSMQELCEGVCNQSTLSRIELNKADTSIYTLEVLMQRLGRDMNLYFDTFLSAQDFEEKQIRDEIISLLVAKDFDAAAELLAELETHKKFQTKVNLQFVMHTKAVILGSRESYTENYLDLRYKAIRITRPNYNEAEIKKYHLSYYEIININGIALYYCNTGELQRGVNILAQLRESINFSYEDETEKVRLYLMVLTNYAKYLGIMERRAEELEAALEGERIAVRNMRLINLPSLVVNKACALLALGKKEESVSYFAQAYYGSALIGRTEDSKTCIEYVRERLGIEFV